MIEWDAPALLWLLLLVPVLGVFVVARLRQRRRALAAFADGALVARLAPDVDLRRRTVREGLRLAALVFLIVALAGPRWGLHWEEVRREGIDLIVALDTSRSMLATDVKPNRIERAKLAVRDLVGMLQGDRVGLVAFAGTAFLECPLTLDYSAFDQSLQSTTVGIIPRGGTALTEAIDVGVEAFDARQGKNEALILITDGEDHEGDPMAAAQRAAERGIKIFTVGVGTADGDLIPLEKQGDQGYLKDRKGQVVKSRLNEKVLQDIAVATGGAYVHGTGASLGLEEIFRDHITKMEKRDLQSTMQRRFEARFQWPLALGLLLLIVEPLIGERRARVAQPLPPRRDRVPRPAGPGRGGGAAVPPASATSSARRAGATAAVALLAFTQVGWLDASRDNVREGNRLYDAGKYDEAVQKYGEALLDAPGSATVRFDLAAAQYKADKLDDAQQSLQKVDTAGDEKLAGRVAYNLGNTLFRKGQKSEDSKPQEAIATYEQALAAYKRAMGANPGDPNPKFNHEFVSNRIAEVKKKLEEQKKQQEQKQQDQQDQQQEQQPQDQQQEQGEKDEQQQQQEQQQQEQQDQATQQPQEGEGEQKPDQGEQQQEEQQKQEQAAPDEKEQPQGDEEKQQAQQPEPGGSDEPPPSEQAEAQPQEGGEGTAGEAAPEDNERREALGVIDTARDEELRPDQMQRQRAVAGVGAAREDW